MARKLIKEEGLLCGEFEPPTNYTRLKKIFYTAFERLCNIFLLLDLFPTQVGALALRWQQL